MYKTRYMWLFGQQVCHVNSSFLLAMTCPAWHCLMTDDLPANLGMCYWYDFYSHRIHDWHQQLVLCSPGNLWTPKSRRMSSACGSSYGLLFLIQVVDCNVLFSRRRWVSVACSLSRSLVTITIWVTMSPWSTYCRRGPNGFRNIDWFCLCVWSNLRWALPIIHVASPGAGTPVRQGSQEKSGSSCNLRTES